MQHTRITSPSLDIDVNVYTADGVTKMVMYRPQVQVFESDSNPESHELYVQAASKLVRAMCGSFQVHQ